MKSTCNIILILMVMTSISSCYYNIKVEPDCQTPDGISFANDVLPIIETSCAVTACHVQGFENGNFNNFDEFKEKADEGFVAQMLRTSQMPPPSLSGPSLSLCEKDIILKWVEEGAKAN